MKSIIFTIAILFFQLSVTAQCNVVICNQNINFSLDSNGEGRMYADIADAGSYDNCDFEVAIYDPTNMIELVPYGDTIMLNCDHLGDMVYRLRDINTQNECWGGISISDMLNVCTSSTDENEIWELETTFSQGILNVNLPSGVESDVHIYNVEGNHLMSEQLSNYNSEMNLTSLSQKGIYIVSTMIHGQMRSKKIVVW